MLKIILPLFLFSILINFKSIFPTKSSKAIIYASDFGVKGDYNGKNGTDNTLSLQNAIDYASTNNKILVLPKGKILLNSYGKQQEDSVHGNILQLKSNITIKGLNSEIIIGNHFHDKSFIVFSGFNSPSVVNFSTLRNIRLQDFSIDFSSNSSYMKTKYSLRKGIEFGQTINGSIENLTFKNGDIVCAIATGYGKKNISKYITIKNSTFINLVKSEQNIDHSTLYINSQNGTFTNNRFMNSNIQPKLMACAVEFHNSNNKFNNNKISGYTRMMYIAATRDENPKIDNLVISQNNAKITNAAIYLWLEENTKFNNIKILSNDITCTHVANYSMLYNGTQGLLADARADKNTSVTNMHLKDNNIKIEKTIFDGRAVKYNTKYNFKDENNSCIGCKDGNHYK